MTESDDNKKTMEEMTPKEFSDVIDRSAGGPGYRKIINLLICVLGLLSCIVVLEAVTARRVARESEKNAAASTVEVIEHRIRSEQGRECILNYMASLIGAQDVDAANAIRRCPPENLSELNNALVVAKEHLRKVDPDNPLLRFDTVPADIAPKPSLNVPSIPPTTKVP